MNLFDNHAIKLATLMKDGYILKKSDVKTDE